MKKGKASMVRWEEGQMKATWWERTKEENLHENEDQTISLEKGGDEYRWKKEDEERGERGVRKRRTKTMKTVYKTKDKRVEICRYKRKETREKTGAWEINERKTRPQGTKELRQMNDKGWLMKETVKRKGENGGGDCRSSQGKRIWCCVSINASLLPRL